MEKPNYALLAFIVLFATLMGVMGGGVMGGIAGYYAAQSAIPAQLVSAPAIISDSNSPPVVQAAPPATTNLVLKEDSAVIDAVRKAKPAVVTVVNQMQSHRGFFGGSGGPTASGSGVIVDAKGYIVTNNHVIEGEQSLQVIFSDGTKADAIIIGSDPVVDVAVIKVDSPVPGVAEFGDSTKVEPGQIAIAIGSPLGDFRGTVTLGIVSALNRRVGKQTGLIQTDAAINNGNSGGPLINSMGQVIGINTLVVRSTSEGNVAEGLGFAIPANVVRDILTQIVANGKVSRPYMGVSYQELDGQSASSLNLHQDQGVIVTNIDPTSPAATAGVHESDVILSIDTEKIDAEHSVSSILLNRKVGDTVTLTILRGTKQIQLKLVLARHPQS